MAENNQLDARIRAVFHRQFETDPDQLDDQTRRGKLQRWDSLGHVGLLTALEEEFHVEIPMDKALAMETVGDVKLAMAQLLSQSPPTSGGQPPSKSNPNSGM